MIYAFRTDIGRRQSNQDFFFIPESNEKPLAIVADGMGGHRAGNVASLIAVEAIHEYIEANDEPRLQILLQHAVSHANRLIFDIGSADSDCAGMGTTVTMAYCEPTRFTYANVGDSRLYLFDGEHLRQLTRDHSFVEELVQSGVITRQEAETHPQKNILTRCVGNSQFVKADTAVAKWEKGNIIVLCSDGLHGSISRTEAETILKDRKDLLDACNRLVDAASANGSTDNITVVLVENEGGELL
ncbi:MAG: Stp1/IreP family PP2C-type Ser/Thr phosphatase [Clostridia bacterium]|nr:Stp1/IreP family PP2C-type Ser/Thr phosphatase [Clostridia bacterium]